MDNSYEQMMALCLSKYDFYGMRNANLIVILFAQKEYFIFSLYIYLYLLSGKRKTGIHN